MRVLAPLVLLLVIAVIVLAWYVAHLRRKIRESDNPRLALTRRDLRNIARKEEERRVALLNLDLQERTDAAVRSFTTPTLNKKEPE